MDTTMSMPFWLRMSDGGGDRQGRHERHERRGSRGPRPGFDPQGFFGPDGPFGQGGPFGPDGPFGPRGPFGPGHRGGRGRARRGDVRQAILALLLEGPRNGYQVIQTLAERTAGGWKPSPGAVYPALSQLTDEGLIRQVEHAGQQAFGLTDAGREAAEAIDPTPWDAFNEEFTSEVGSDSLGAWAEYASAGKALAEVMRVGTDEQKRAASDLVAETRRKLYGLLAQE